MKTSQAIKDFLNWQGCQNPNRITTYGSALNQLCLYLKDKQLERITEKDILNWIQLMRDLGYKPNTFIVKIPAVRSFFRYYYKRKHKVLDPDLIPVPRQEGNMWKVKEEEKYKKLLSVVKPEGLLGKRDRALILMLMDTGARISEILSLKIGDVDLIEKRAIIKTLKSRGLRPVRELCWTERTNQALKDWLETFQRPPSETLWPCFSGPGIGKGMKTRSAEEIFKKYCRKADIPLVRPHELRHRLGHILAKKNVSPVMIANILGHSSIQSSLRYTMLDNLELRGEYHRVLGA